MHILFLNKKFGLNYSSIESYECGISLKGTEVKSITKANATIDESFAIIKDGEAFLVNMYVAPFEQDNRMQVLETTRKRKLLLHKHEIQKIEYKMKKEKLTLVPTKVYLQNGMVKIEIALSKHKKAADKRNDIKIRDAERHIKKIV
ncbi:MAG: SsrA-binding protein SmpB [Mycoplasmataceae bacterium]|jgi:SsrA-binding protein|nr:SsrA-binding protein SmpB [Mycoplasmataceae bacterium]